MKIALINTNTRYTGELYTTLPPLGPLYIASYLKEHGHEVIFIDADIDDLSHEQIGTILKKERPSLIGITMNILMVKAGYELAQYLKQHMDIPIVVGGPYPSAVVGQVFKECAEIDFVVNGEGEQTVLELVEHLEGSRKLADINGLCYRVKDEIHNNKLREYIADLDTLPFPDFELIDNLKKYKGTYPIGDQPSLLIFGSRGCPFSCTFCNDSVWRSKNRKRSPENVVKEIVMLQERYGVREIFFQDDTMNLDRKWFEDICDLIIEAGLNKKISFKAPFRANRKLIDEALLKKAHEAGFWMLFYGVESGDPRILSKISKGITREEIERAFTLTKKAGMRTLASFMIGNLEEDRESILNSLKFFKKIDPDYGGFAIATPFPGTALYIEGLKKGLLKEYDYNTFTFGKAVVNTGKLKPEDVEKLREYVYAEVLRFKGSFSRKMRTFLSNLSTEGPAAAFWLAMNGMAMFVDGKRYGK
ncbi:MAG: B12-binding domain-containing radical SAM protein [Thermodesulfobacteriota bacterium]